MQYIVMDLEWNQPISYSSAAYRNVGEKLLFEMIQIGAVKLDENLEVIDTFTQLIRPIYYVKLHPRIKRITHISQEELEEAPLFSEALTRFADFCGQDYALITWGCDDVSVLEQNKRFFHCSIELSDIYDMQRVYGEMIGNTKERQGLQAAMAHFEIDPDEEKPFHNALNDAWYTAMVLRRLPEPAKVLQYPLKPKLLQHNAHTREMRTELRLRGSIGAVLSCSAAQQPPCPVCGKKLTVPEGYVRLGPDRFMALADCPQHGLVFSTIEKKTIEEGKQTLVRTTALSDEQSKAYISTKHIQWRNKLKLQGASSTP
ncbi:MAG: exonuclease domain-containing protein [Clostridia bacterium]|nr:exonuclease domain-containing protein [Clostridia bacterium]